MRIYKIQFKILDTSSSEFTNPPLLKMKDYSGGKSTPAIASASYHTHAAKAKALSCPRPTSSSKSKKTVVLYENEGNKGEDNHTTLNAKITYLENL